MNRTVRSSQPASDEFAAAVRWYEERRQGVGAEFFEAVAGVMTLIEAHPERHSCRRRRADPPRPGARFSISGHLPADPERNPDRCGCPPQTSPRLLEASQLTVPVRPTLSSRVRVNSLSTRPRTCNVRGYRMRGHLKCHRRTVVAPPPRRSKRHTRIRVRAHRLKRRSGSEPPTVRD